MNAARAHQKTNAFDRMCGRHSLRRPDQTSEHGYNFLLYIKAFLLRQRRIAMAHDWTPLSRMRARPRTPQFVNGLHCPGGHGPGGGWLTFRPGANRNSAPASAFDDSRHARSTPADPAPGRALAPAHGPANETRAMRSPAFNSDTTFTVIDAMQRF